MALNGVKYVKHVKNYNIIVKMAIKYMKTANVILKVWE